MAHQTHYTEYYVNQAQTGAGMTYYSGLPSQKGYGIGSFLGGLFRSVLPFLKQGAQAVGREALRAGSHILADAATGEQPLQQSLKRHAEEAGRNLATRAAAKLRGGGIKRPRLAVRRQSFRGHQARRISRSVSRPFDILGK